MHQTTTLSDYENDPNGSRRVDLCLMERLSTKDSAACSPDASSPVNSVVNCNTTGSLRSSRQHLRSRRTTDKLALRSAFPRMKARFKRPSRGWRHNADECGFPSFGRSRNRR